MAKESIPVIIDVSHHQRGVRWSEVKAGGIEAVLVKATQGLTYKDDLYDSHTKGVKDQGMLHGAYHFGTFGDGKKQADHFLAVVQPGPETLLALDFEDDPRGPDMTGPQAEAFVKRIKEKTGRWPMFYSANYWTQPHLDKSTWPTMINCPLWLAGYVKPNRLVIPKPWKNWTVWQYTEGIHGIEPHETPGIKGGGCDRGRFLGTVEELRDFWTGQNVPDHTPTFAEAAISEAELPADAPETTGDTQVAQTIVNTATAPETPKPPVEGGGVNDPAQKVIDSSKITKVLGTVGGTNALGGVWAAMHGKWVYLALFIVTLSLVGVVWVTRKTWLDILRLKLFADPSKINVK